MFSLHLASFSSDGSDLKYLMYSQVGVGVRPVLLRLWEDGDSRVGVGCDVCLHPACSLLHCGVLGIFVPQLFLQVGAVCRHGPRAVCNANVRAGSLPHPRSFTLPAAARLAVHSDTGAGECVYRRLH